MFVDPLLKDAPSVRRAGHLNPCLRREPLEDTGSARDALGSTVPTRTLEGIARKTFAASVGAAPLLVGLLGRRALRRLHRDLLHLPLLPLPAALLRSACGGLRETTEPPQNPAINYDYSRSAPCEPTGFSVVRHASSPKASVDLLISTPPSPLP